MKIPNPSNMFQDIDDFIMKAYSSGWFIWAIVGAVALFLLTFCTKIK